MVFRARAVFNEDRVNYVPWILWFHRRKLQKSKIGVPVLTTIRIHGVRAFEPSTTSRSMSAPGSSTSGDTSSFIESGWNSEGTAFSQPLQGTALGIPKRQRPSRENQSYTPESSSTSMSCPELLAAVNLAVSK
jgi:hypothetical protein